MLSDREQRWAERRNAIRADVETRALVPNGNDPDDNPPATVGPPTAEGGDPNGVEIIGDDAPWRTTSLLASPWSGWPDEWCTPLVNGARRLGELTDTAWMCLDKNSAACATMPAYRTVDGEIAPRTSWMRNPDPDLYTSWTEFAKQLFWDFWMGEAFVLPTAWLQGRPARFHVVQPWMVNAEMMGGRRRYSIGSLDVTDEILHIRYKSTTDDARGHGPLEAGQARVIAAAALARMATNVARGGGVPHSAIVSPAELLQGQVDKLLMQWWESRTRNLGLPAILSGGIDIKTLQFSPKDMALLDLSQFNEARIAELLSMTPFLVGLPSGGDSLTYSTTAQLFDYHWRQDLRPAVAMVMDSLSQWALPENESLELNRDEYVRPGFSERVTAWAQLHGIEDETGRAIDAAEIRAAERLNGDQAPAIMTGGVNA